MKNMPLCQSPRVFVLAALGCLSISAACATTSDLDIQIRRLMNGVGWPEMTRIALQRGDLQRVAKAQVSTAEQRSCVDASYTEQKVLERIADGYAEIYSDPSVVSETADFVSDPGARRIFAAVASRAPAVGASAAYEEQKANAWSTLSPEEQKRFNVFANSKAGQLYLSVRPRQLRIHQEKLAQLAKEIAQACLR